MNDNNLIPFKPGHDNRRNLAGRPKRIYTLLKESGATKDDIVAAFAEVGWQTRADLETILANEDAPMFLKVLAKALIKGADKGDFRYISEMMAYVLGKPKEQTENKHLHKILVEYVNPNDRALSTSPEPTEDTQRSEEV